MVKPIVLNKSTHTLLEPGIIKIVVRESEFLELEDVKLMHEANLKLSENKSFCVLLDVTRKYFSVSTEGKELLAGEEYSKVLKASAFVVTSLATKIMGSLFIKINKPKSPTQLFTNENQALEWLKNFNYPANSKFLKENIQV